MRLDAISVTSNQVELVWLNLAIDCVCEWQLENSGRTSIPAAVVPVSAMSGEGVPALGAVLKDMLQTAAKARMQTLTSEHSNYGLDW